MKVTNHDKEWAPAGEYASMTTMIEGYDNISYEEKKKKAEADVLEFISGCGTIEEVRAKMEATNDVQPSGRLYLMWAVIDAVVSKGEVWWATRTD